MSFKCLEMPSIAQFVPIFEIFPGGGPQTPLQCTLIEIENKTV